MKKYWPINLVIGSFLMVVAGAVYCLEFVPHKPTAEVIGMLLVFSSAFMVATGLGTALFCERRAARGKDVSYGTVIWAAAIGTVATMACGCLLLDGANALTVHYWAGSWPIVRRWLILWPWGLTVSALVALAVVVYFKRRLRTHESQTVASVVRTPEPER
jgi:hypothetical protein